MKTVVILGASYGGIGTAHRLLQQGAKLGGIQVVLVAPNTHFYWNIASTRALVPGLLADEKVFHPIAPGFTQYKNGTFKFVVGTAESLNTELKRVTVVHESQTRLLDYDILIVATGSRTRDYTPFKSSGSYETTRAALHEFQDKVAKATSIVVAGAGATGVETAGELGFEYKKEKKIILVSSGSKLLPGAPPSVSQTATDQLLKLDVDIKFGLRVTGATTDAAGRTELLFSNGQMLTTDLYLPAAGLVPNSSFLPPKLLDSKGFLLVDEFLRVRGVKDIWAVGDISAVQRPQFINTDSQSVHVARSICLLLKGKSLIPYKVSKKNMMLVPVGRKVGTGYVGSMKFPSFMVAMIKGKTLFTQNMVPLINGTAA